MFYGSLAARAVDAAARAAAQGVEACPHCNRTLIRRAFCMDCGKPVAADPLDR